MSNLEADFVITGIVLVHMVILLGIRIYFGCLDKKDQEQADAADRENSR